MINKKDLYWRGIERWGYRAQLIKAVEEMGELTADICRILNGNRSTGDIYFLGELADVKIMVEQLEYMVEKTSELALQEYELVKDEKLRRLEKILLAKNCEGENKEKP